MYRKSEEEIQSRANVCRTIKFSPQTFHPEQEKKEEEKENIVFSTKISLSRTIVRMEVHWEWNGTGFTLRTSCNKILGALSICGTFFSGFIIFCIHFIACSSRIWRELHFMSFLPRWKCSSGLKCKSKLWRHFLFPWNFI